MAVFNHVHDLVQNTPLLLLPTFSANPNVKIYAKLELLNPAGGIKDRFGVHIIRKLIDARAIDEDSVLIEATAGNTGLGVALGLIGTNIQQIYVIPTKFALEKQQLLRAMGAQIINTPEADGIEGAVRVAKELRDVIPNSFGVHQFTSSENPNSHYLTTGPEIYRDLEGHIDYFVMGAGSGGTLSGISHYLKSQDTSIQTVLADPIGSVLGGGMEGEYEIEGIGNHFQPDTLDASHIDAVIKVSDTEALSAVQKLAHDTGIFAGSSSGAHLAAAYALSKTLTSGVIVTILADRGERYLSKNIFDTQHQ